MINVDVRYTLGEGADIAGDEGALQELCAAIELCVQHGFEVDLESSSNINPAPYKKLLKRIVISIHDSSNTFSVSDDALLIEGDENFLLTVRSNIPWDADDPHSGLCSHVHFDRISFSDCLDDESIDVILTKKRKC